MTPRFVVVMPRSLRMRANTGNAVIAIATPMNRAKLVNGTPSCESRGYSSRATAAPSKNGATMLACDTATVACARFRSSPAFSSSPTRNMYRMMPNCAMMPTWGAASGGRTQTGSFGWK